MENIIDEIVFEISKVEGISAVVLGGSRARGTHTAKSDIDLGIYYHPDRPLDMAALNQIATRFDDEHRDNILTPIGGWGPWINGGGWLNVGFTPVDFLYRDLGKVAAVIDASHQGLVDVAYQPGHPLGFVSSIYMGEVAVCKILSESDRQELTDLKARTAPYPAALKQGLINRFAWEIDFSLAIARKGVSRGDVVYAAGCCFRAVMCMLQTLFALNEQYWLNEKGAVLFADGFARQPVDLKSRIESAFTVLSENSKDIDGGIDILEKLKDDITGLVEGEKG